MAETTAAFAENMQVAAGEIDRGEQGAVSANALDQREEFGAVRNLALKIATDRIDPDSFCPQLDSGGVVADEDGGREGVTACGHKISKSSDSQEFEFSLCGAAADGGDDAEFDGISPADDLFFKGQLLPLNLPTRLQIMQRLSSPKRSDVSKETPGAVAAVASTGGARLATLPPCLFEPENLKCPSIGDESCLGSALVNSRSSSFHSQGSHNFWESDSPGELDSGDCSSSRDSSGSSQDACSESEKRGGLPKLFHDHSRSSSELLALGRGKAFLYSRHILDGRSCRLPPQSDKPQLSSWLRSSFKWKVFFGLKKPSRFSYTEGGVPATVITERGGQCGGKADNPRKDSRDFGVLPPTSKCGTLHTSADITASPEAAPHCDEEQQKAGACLEKEECGRELEFNAELFSFPGADTELSYREATAAAAAVGTSPDEALGAARSTAPSKPREGVHKYFNILKPSSNGRAAARPQSQTLETSVKAAPIPRTKSSFSGDLMISSASKQASSTAVPSKGAPSPKPAAAQKTAPSGPEQPRCRSPTSQSLSSNLRIPSFSRGSKTSSTAGRSGSSHSGPLSSSPSTMAEFQSSIQGAIAHCKQSQSVAK